MNITRHIHFKLAAVLATTSLLSLALPVGAATSGGPLILNQSAASGKTTPGGQPLAFRRLGGRGAGPTSTQNTQTPPLA